MMQQGVSMCQILFCQWHVKPVLMPCLKPVAFCVCSVQQNDQIPCYQPLPLHGYDIYHLSAKGGLWLQGQHCAAGEQMNGSHRDTKYEKLHDKTYSVSQDYFSNQYDSRCRKLCVSLWS